MLIALILGIPFLLSVSAAFVNRRIFGLVNSCGYLAVLLSAALLFKDVVLSGKPGDYPEFILLDPLSAFFVLLIAIVAFAVSLYSVAYIKKDLESARISEKKAGTYYLLFNLFCLAMFVVPLANNLGLLWVAIEMTTLVSAFLVGFYNTKESVEAAWKYIIICSVGIIFALLGTILFSYAYSLTGSGKSLNWTDLSVAAQNMDKNILKIAFIFILVGYGTKAGLAPMHTWLPDAHSQAISPISALLSGVLLKTAVYAILRFGIIASKAAGFAYFGKLMLLLGMISLAISAGLVLVQKDLKRLLAYSSIEHVGVICVGFGLGTPLAIAGALMHIFNHALTKSLMFFGAGNIVTAYRKHNMNSIRGVIKALPFTGIMVLLGVFALTGFPPFSIFISELMIALAAFTGGAYLTGGLLLFFLTVIFGAFIFHFGRMLFGHIPRDMRPQGEPLSGKIAFLFLFIQICISGLVLLWFKKDLIWIAQRLFQG